MAQAIAFKNLGVALETTYGASTALTAYLPVKSFNLGLDSTVTLKEDTSTTVYGYDRSANLKNTVEGDLTFSADPITISYWIRMGMGQGATLGSGFIPGGGATAWGFFQNSSGTLPSYRIDRDENTMVQQCSGVVAKGFELTSSGEFVEGTLNLIGKGITTGAAITVTGITMTPFVFADTHIYYGATITGCTTEVQVEDWSLSYDMQVESAFLSGNRDVARVDPKVPKLTGNWKRFYDDTNFASYMVGDTAKALKFSIVAPSAYSGTSAYRVDFYLPKVKITKSDRPYEAGGFIKESVEFTGIYDSSVGYLLRSIVTNGAATIP